VTTVFMFPGQSSRYPEMFERLAERSPALTREVLSLASDLVGRDLAGHYVSSNAGAFETNRDVQLGVFLASHVHMLAAERAGVRAELSVGLSLGEYNHLVHIGAIDFRDAVRLVWARGTAYDQGPPGAMSSVFPLSYDELALVVEAVRAEGGGVLEIGNLNSPTQNVLSGDARAIAAATELLEREHGVEPVLIEPRIAMHSSLFAGVGRAFSHTLAVAPWRAPHRPYLPNTTGDFELEPSPSRIAAHLTAHVSSPVQFRRSIERLVAVAPDATFVEVGPRSVLYNLLSRKWIQNKRARTDSPEPLPEELRSSAPGPAHERPEPSRASGAEVSA
jgi:[acyl-carrier-protein] S-malonyltransferase